MEATKKLTGKSVKKWLGNNAIIVLMLLVSLFVGIIHPNFFAPANLINLFKNVSIRYIIALGISGCLITTGNDLSAGRLAGFAACLACIFAQTEGAAGKFYPNMPTLPTPVVFILVIAIAYGITALMRISIGHRGVFRFMLCFGNVGFIGFPVLSAIYGSDALIYATIFNLPFNFLVFTVGAWFLTHDSEDGSEVKVSWRTFVSPVIVSCVIAIALALTNVHNIPVVGEAFVSLGSLTTPAALLIIGSSLANLPAKELIGGFRLWMTSVFRLIIIPLAVWGVFHFFIENPLLLGVIVVISGMPVATNGTMLCYQYGGNSHDMAQGTFVTTVASLVSIPLLVMFLSTVG